MSLFDSLARTILNNLGPETQQQLMQQATAFIQQQGGVSGLVQKFHDNGLGHVVESWIGTGANQPISPDQVHQVFGPQQIQALAQQLGVDPGHAAMGLAQLLPNLVDKLTPNGQVPAANEIEQHLATLLQGGLGKLLG